jgi:hypothetical protein
MARIETKPGYACGASAILSIK